MPRGGPSIAGSPSSSPSSQGRSWREAALCRCLHRRCCCFGRREAAVYRRLYRRRSGRREAALCRCLHRLHSRWACCSAEVPVAVAAVVLGGGLSRNYLKRYLLFPDRPVYNSGCPAAPSQWLDCLTPLHGQQWRGYRRCCCPLPLPQRLLGHCCCPSRPHYPRHPHPCPYSLLPPARAHSSLHLPPAARRPPRSSSLRSALPPTSGGGARRSRAHHRGGGRAAQDCRRCHGG